LTHVAKKRAVDRHRSTAARIQREKNFADVFELRARAPNEVLEVSVEARRVMERLIHSRLDPKDRELLQLILLGERSTRRLAEALGLGPMPEDELRREVKRHRDRLMKLLERLGKEEPDDKS
jgi:RNA polymerase sigma-70 factor (ECF subfamily)